MTRLWHGFRGTPHTSPSRSISIEPAGAHSERCRTNARSAFDRRGTRGRRVRRSRGSGLRATGKPSLRPPRRSRRSRRPAGQDESDEPTISTEQFGVVAPLLAPTPAFAAAAPADATNELAPAADAYLRALLEHNAVQAESAVVQSEQSEDMLVDTINEAFFDLVGDTVIEFSAAGPQIIEDYEADVRGYLDHE